MSINKLDVSFCMEKGLYSVEELSPLASEAQSMTVSTKGPSSAIYWSTWRSSRYDMLPKGSASTIPLDKVVIKQVFRRLTLCPANPSFGGNLAGEVKGEQWETNKLQQTGLRSFLSKPVISDRIKRVFKVSAVQQILLVRVSLN